MALSGDLSAADVAAVMGNNNGSNNGFGWGDGSFWIIILFLFAFMGNGWGNGWGNGGATANTVQADVQRGFDQSATMAAINGVNTSVNNGFANAEISGCDRMANLTAQMNNIAMQQLSNNCENRASIADLKYVISQENAQDRVSISSGVRDILENQNAGIQKILDTMCQDRIDAKNERIADLQNQLTMANLATSQAAQTAAIISNNEAQTANLIQRLNPTPIPAYLTNPVTPYASYSYGCGCSGAVV